VKGGSVTITGPLKRVPRIYIREIKSAEASISKLERHLSEIVEQESLRGVEERYCSPPGGHFALLQMLQDSYSLGLLVLEATGDGSNGINVYRRVGALTLRYFPEESMTSPDVTTALERIETSLTAHLRSRNKNDGKQKLNNDGYLELRREPWMTEIVIII
jgi:hypothetical protein